jgi:hypothetical protein
MSKSTVIGKEGSGKSAGAGGRGVVRSVHRLPEESESNEGADYLIFQQRFESRTSRIYSIHYPKYSRHYPIYSRHYPIYSRHYPIYSRHYPIYSRHYPIYSRHYPIYSRHYPT